MAQNKIHVAVLMGGPSAEHAVSLKTGSVVVRDLDSRKYRISPVVVDKRGKWRFPHTARPMSYGEALDYLHAKPYDVVFITMHGLFGEDGRVQALLDTAGIPYTGSGVLASALAMDKARTAELLSLHGLRVPMYEVVTKVMWHRDKEKTIASVRRLFTLPCVVKPVALGSSVGISIVRKWNELPRAALAAFREGDEIMAQEFICGTEIACAVIDEGNGRNAVALPPTEIIPKSSAFFDYNAKYVAGASDEITPARLSSHLTQRVQSAALTSHTVLGCSGMSRTDMILRMGAVYILETNTIPGMTETSLLPQAARAAGIRFPRFLDGLVRAAFRARRP